MSRDCQVKVRFCPPPAELRRYFTTFYLVETQVPPGGRLDDGLHPEWANLRFHQGDRPVGTPRSGTPVSGTDFVATGPSSRALPFSIGTTRMWGVGLLPLGWAKFVHGDASDLADAVVDGHRHPAFASFRPLADSLFGQGADPEAELARICAHFLARIDEPVADKERIGAIHAALIDPEVGSVADLVARVGTGQRTVERICSRAFGFAPKLLLRRQRFMRSLAQYMLDPTLRWIGVMDGHYHDQAQFVRDFKQFMDMTPRQYAAAPKPIVGAIARERAHFAGAAVQTLDSPEGTSGARASA